MFDLITTLKEVGLSLEEIKNYMDERDTGEEYFIISDRPKNNSEKELFAVVSRLWDYCTKHNAYDDFVTGEIIPYENIVNGTFATGWFSSRVDKKAKSRYLHVKPAGCYAVKYIRSSYYALQEEYRKFCCELHELGYEPNGSIYQNDITNYLSERYADDYLMKIEVSVKRHDENGCK